MPVAAATAKVVARDANNVKFVETVCNPSLHCSDKTLGKNHIIYDFSPEFFIV